ncbi:MAG: hypothetical protein P8X74_13000 [Reinekea sp.]|jgi:hypothetical protein
MKTRLIVLATGTLLLAATQASAKDTLIDLDNASVGGFGGPTFKYSRIMGQDSLEIGGMGGATFTTGKHSIMIGGGGYGLVNEVDENIDMGYGGLVFGYTYNPEAIAHVDSRLLLGAGSIEELHNPGSDDDVMGSFLVAELSTQLDVNVTNFMEIGFGASYRTVTKPSKVNIANKDLSSPSLFISIQFGSL